MTHDQEHLLRNAMLGDLPCKADDLVTHDQEHLLRNAMLGDLPCKAGSPGDCLTWLRQRWTEEVKAE